MSYAGKAGGRRKTETDRIRNVGAIPVAGSVRATASVARPSPRRGPEVDWQQVAIFATGMVLGLAVGAGGGLLFAPRSGADAREAIARRGRRMGARTHDAWDDLRDELRWAGRRSKRKLGRAMRHKRWALQDRFAGDGVAQSR